MERRNFLRVAGVLVVGGTVGTATTFARRTAPLGGATLPAGDTPAPPSSVSSGGARPPEDGARLHIPAAGTYRISGRVRMQESLVEIGGIANAKQISRSLQAGAPLPVVEFSSMESFATPGPTGGVTVRGGFLEALTATPIDVA